MAKPPITTKNLEGLHELMLLEDLIYKKYKTYAECASNTQVRSMFEKHAQNHKSRFDTLFDYLNQHE